MTILFARIGPPTGYVRPMNEVHPEYPKWVHFTDGRPSVVADDAEAEASLLAGKTVERITPEVASAAPSMVLVGENDEMAMLKKIAEQHGIKIDGRWKLSKVRAAVTAVMPLPKSE